MKGKIIRKWMSAFVFVIPALTFYLIFQIYPILSTFFTSFFKWDGASPKKIFVGLDNFKDIFTDRVFWLAVGHNIFWIVFTICIPTIFGIVLAVLLNKKNIKGRLFFRVVFYMPCIVSMVAISIIWKWILNPEFGILNRVLKAIGLGAAAVDWLGNERFVMWGLLISGSWVHYGFCMVIALAALQGIDKSYIEVAELDGATPFQMMVYVIMPLLKNTFTLLALNSLIGSFKVFEIVYMMTKGGPYHMSEVMSTYMYTAAFKNSEFGRGSAIATVLSIFIGASSLIYLRVSERGDDQ
jgi:ABC-type sugar transport system permease subunit